MTEIWLRARNPFHLRSNNHVTHSPPRGISDGGYVRLTTMDTCVMVVVEWVGVRYGPSSRFVPYLTLYVLSRMRWDEMNLRAWIILMELWNIYWSCISALHNRARILDLIELCSGRTLASQPVPWVTEDTGNSHLVLRTWLCLWNLY